MALARKKTITINEMRARASAFAQTHADSTDEKRDAQTWWNDFFEVFGARRHGQAIFEATAKRFSTGNAGFIDCFMPGVFIGEAKSRGLIAKAHDQMVDYLAGGSIGEGEQPRYLVATDMQLVNLYDRDAASYPEPLASIVIDDLADHLESFSFIAGGFKPREQINLEAASVKAAKYLAELQDTLYKPIDDDDPDREQLELERAVFMTRLLFLMYGDDVDGLWAKGQFYRLMDEHTSEDGSDVQGALLSLFQVLATPTRRRSDDLQAELDAFPYVNGGLFNDYGPVPAFNRRRRMELLSVCRVDWSGLSPAIFGSLFQGLATRAQRRQTGEHYTSERNILKALEPLFLDELEDRFRASTLSYDKLEALRKHLGTIRVLDPACGCGNFLIVAYQRLADLELRILERQRDLSGETGRTLDAFTTIDLAVRPHQFYGIEFKWWPVKIAETAMFLTQHRVTQALESIGVPPEILPIQDSASITHDDALEVDWRGVCEPTATTYVVGNPPFIGQDTRDKKQLAQLQRVWGTKEIGRLDYVTAWYVLARRFFGDIAGRWSLVTTNSLTQGVQVDPVFTPIFEDGWRIRFAHRTFGWTTEATGAPAVHCVIVGFDRVDAPAPRLFSYENARSAPVGRSVRCISPYLIEGVVRIVRPRTSPLAPDLAPAYLGAMPKDGGGFVIEPDDYASVVADPLAAKYVRPYVGSRELVDGTVRHCLWLKDLDFRDVDSSPILRERLKTVREYRASSTAESTRARADTAHLFAQKGVQYAHGYLAVPRVFSENYRRVPAVHLDAQFIVSDLAYSIDDPDGLAYAVISSQAFLLWQHTIGGRLESRIRFGPTTTWNNFPLPSLTSAQRARLIAAGEVLTAACAGQSRPLSLLFKSAAMPADVVSALRAIDRAIGDVLGLGSGADDEATVTRLLELYAAATA